MLALGDFCQFMPAILLIEDNCADTVLLRRAFEATGVLWDCSVVSDGKIGMEYLSEAMRTGTLPAYVLMDLKLPRFSGLEVLAWMRTLQELRKIRVIVFTSSSSDEDRANAERFGLDAYVSKPSNMDEYKKVVRRIAELWQLPPAVNRHETVSSR